MTNCFYSISISEWSAESQLIAPGRLQKASHWYQCQIIKLLDFISFYLLTKWKYICFACVSGSHLLFDWIDRGLHRFPPPDKHKLEWMTQKQTQHSCGRLCNTLLESDWNTISLIRSKSVLVFVYLPTTQWVVLCFNLNSMLIVTPEYWERGGQGIFLQCVYK